MPRRWVCCHDTRPPYVAQDTTLSGPIFTDRFRRNKRRRQYQMIRFRRALDEMFPMPPLSALILVLPWRNQAFQIKLSKSIQGVRYIMMQHTEVAALCSGRCPTNSYSSSTTVFPCSASLDARIPFQPLDRSCMRLEPTQYNITCNTRDVTQAKSARGHRGVDPRGHDASLALLRTGCWCGCQ